MCTCTCTLYTHTSAHPEVLPYQILLVLECVVEHCDPILVTTHQNIPLLLKASSLGRWEGVGESRRRERGRGEWKEGRERGRVKEGRGERRRGSQGSDASVRNMSSLLPHTLLPGGPGLLRLLITQPSSGASQQLRSH